MELFLSAVQFDVFRDGLKGRGPSRFCPTMMEETLSALLAQCNLSEYSQALQSEG